MSGRLITLEGLDGVGKSTQAALLLDYCRGRGWETQLLREPGETTLGEELRRLLKSGAASSPAAELLLFTAARAELLQELVRPALQKGQTVILDRFTESTLAYQGALQVFDEQRLLAVAQLAAGGLVPDLTLLLDLETADALHRRHTALGPGNSTGQAPAKGSAQVEVIDAIERRGNDYFERVRLRYLALQQNDPQRIILINAAPGPEVVAQSIRAAVEAKWPI